MSKRNNKSVTKSNSYVNPHKSPHFDGKIIKSRSYLAKLKEKQDQLLREGLIANSKHIISENPSIFSDRSFNSEKSIEQKHSLLCPVDEEILNVIRMDQPKAEIRTSPLFNSGKYHSPINITHMREKREEMEKELRSQRAKYRTLESQYNEILTQSSHTEVYYNNILCNLRRELELFEDDSPDPLISGFNAEIEEIKARLAKLVEKSEAIEKKLNPN